MALAYAGSVPGAELEGLRRALLPTRRETAAVVLYAFVVAGLALAVASPLGSVELQAVLIFISLPTSAVGFYLVHGIVGLLTDYNASEVTTWSATLTAAGFLCVGLTNGALLWAAYKAVSAWRRWVWPARV